VASIGLGALMIVWGNKDNDQLSQCQPIAQQTASDHSNHL